MIDLLFLEPDIVLPFILTILIFCQIFMEDNDTNE